MDKLICYLAGNVTCMFAYLGHMYEVEGYGLHPGLVGIVCTLIAALVVYWVWEDYIARKEGWFDE